MLITREFLAQRLSEAQQRLRQAGANMNVALGAVTALQMLVADLDSPDQKETAALSDTPDAPVEKTE